VDESLISLVGNLLLPMLAPGPSSTACLPPSTSSRGWRRPPRAAGDFDGDGVADLVVTNRGSGTVASAANLLPEQRNWVGFVG
jgi:hypothetical protein